jgi:hypothetical protein
MKLSKSFFVTIGIVLGIIILINMFLIDASVEGFQEGNPSRTTLGTLSEGKTSCKNSFAGIDEWFNKPDTTMASTESFFKNGGIIPKAKLPFTVNKKDNCDNYIRAKVNQLAESEKNAAPTAPATTTTTNTQSAASPQNAEQVLAALNSADVAIDKAKEMVNSTK